MTNAKTLAWSLVLCSLGTGALAVAQSNRPESTPGDHCPMKAAAELSDVKVELTKTGAIIRLNAKRQQDISAVQESAQEIAAALSSGNCLMRSDHECAHHHAMHQHDKAPNAPK